MSDGLDELIAVVKSVEPVAGVATLDHVDRARRAVAEGAPYRSPPVQLDDEQRATMVIALKRAAAIAVAAGDVASAEHFLGIADTFADDEQRAELAAGRADPAGFRGLVHGRYLIAMRKERRARAAWSRVKKTTRDETLRRAAIAELQAPRPIDSAPSLFTFNGVGVRLAGRRDPRPDGSYIATHCICFAFIPLIPLRAYRVRDAGSKHYLFTAREQLSPFARIARLVVVAAVALGLGGATVSSYLDDPDRLARKRLDGALALERGDDPEAALAALDAALADTAGAGVGDRAQRAGAAIVRLSATYVASPFGRDAVDPAHRVVVRYRALPEAARGGVARDAMLAALDRWIAALTGPEDLEGRLLLLRDGAAIAADRRYDEPIYGARRALATSLEAEAPLDAVAVLVAPPTEPGLATMATLILEKLIDQPSVLADAGEDIDAWLAAAPANEPLRDTIEHARTLGAEARTEAEAEGVTAEQLAHMQTQRPWDQHVAVQLARAELAAGKPAAAEKRLRGFGPPARLIREARYVLAQIALDDGRLDVADELLSRLLRGRLPRFLAARATLDTATQELWARLDLQLRTGQIPASLREELEGSTERIQQEKIVAWGASEAEADPKVAAARASYAEYGDVVRFALGAGTVKLRRAQALDGGARDAMLADAERAFLAIRTEAEGQPEYQLGLGEVYARLGKAADSEAAFQKVLDRGDADLTLAVARVYRELGSTERATAVATGVYEQGDTVHKHAAAVLLFLMAGTEDDRAAWLSKADPTEPFVRTSKLELDGRRALLEGDHAACDRAFAKAAEAHLAMGGDGINNAALAQQSRFFCTGDLRTLAQAEATLERAYRAAPDNPLVVGNLTAMLAQDAELRVIGRRIDVTALRPRGDEVAAIIGALLDGSERETVLGELATDRGTRRSDELTAQEEILTPSGTTAYERRLQRARRRRDPKAMSDVVARLRAAKSLDTSDAVRGRERWVAGELDADLLENEASVLARADAIATAKGVDARTRAAAHLIAGHAHALRAAIQGDASEAKRAEGELTAAVELWPALEIHDAIASTIVDEAGLAADAARWKQERRLRSSIDVVARLVAAHDPLGEAVRASPQWALLATVVAADRGRPGLDAWRLARLLGDAAALGRARPALSDEMIRLALDADEILTPGDPTIADDRALLAAP